MRAVCIFSVLILGLGSLSAQQQERQLIDRILKPDLSLQNNAQGKQFSLKSSNVTANQASTKWFHFRKRQPEKSFADTRQAGTKNFTTGNFRDGQLKSHGTSNFVPTRGTFPTNSANMVKNASENGQNLTMSQVHGTRPFLVQGKNQKALNSKNRPLSLDEVRELLNKNK